MSTRKKKMKQNLKQNHLILAVGLALIVALPVIVYFNAQQKNLNTNAAGAASIEVENATKAGNVTNVNDANASGGTYVKFGTASSSAWPGPTNTGVPAGTVLSAYTGPCTITTANTVIDSKTVNCGLAIKAANVMIKNSKVNGIILLDTDLAGSDQWSFTLQDSEVDAGTIQQGAVSSGNLTVIRSNIYGGENEVQCEAPSSHCNVQDSWLHGQYIPPTGNWHLDGFISDGATNILLKHNYIVCDAAVNLIEEGCTAAVAFIPNFGPISFATVENNLFGANIGASYCTYGGEKPTSPTPHSDHIVYKDNVFQRGTNGKCGAYGPVTNFDVNGVGNQWINNTWEDGAPVQPAN